MTTLAATGSTVYAGGAFSSIGGRARNHIAALDSATGHATGWNPNAAGTVTTLAVSGRVVYAGGYFRSIGGAAREGIAALDTATGQARSGIAALDVTTGLATAWNPNANKAVDAFAVSGATVYVGGYVTRIGGQPRNGIAGLDAATGHAKPWNPNAQPIDSGVGALAASAGTVYAGGKFERIGGQARNGLAALDAATGRALPFNALDLSGASALAASGSDLYVGGDDGIAVVAISRVTPGDTCPEVAVPGADPRRIRHPLG